jgi:aminoglycoside phosphotransferase (APT) family kinase protein
MTSIGLNRARGLIRELSPLVADEIEVLGQGTESAAFRVDSAWVVRFPLVPEAQRTLRRELALLPELAQRLGVAVPRPEHVAQAKGQLVFSAYRMLEGEPLSDAALAGQSRRVRERALDELAALLEAIHRFPLVRGRAAGVSLERYKGGYHEAQQALQHAVDGMLGAAEFDSIARQHSAFERARQTRSGPVLLHADIKPAHLLHDPRTGALTGLIDWGDVSLGQADFDLAIVGAFCGPQTLQGLLGRMDDADTARARAAIPFLLTIRWLQDLNLVIRDGDEELAERCLYRLREHLRTDAV